MENEVYWLLEMSVREGELDNVRALMEEMVTATEADEPGALDYEWYVSDNGQTVHLFERYADSDATLTHLRNFQQKFASRFMSAMSPRRWTIYGNPDERVRRALEGQGALFMEPLGGFTR